MGGELIVSVPNDVWFPYRIQFLLGKIPQNGGVDEFGYDWGHLHKFNRKILTSILTSSA